MHCLWPTSGPRGPRPARVQRRNGANNLRNIVLARQKSNLNPISKLTIHVSTNLKFFEVSRGQPEVAVIRAVILTKYSSTRVLEYLGT